MLDSLHDISAYVDGGKDGVYRLKLEIYNLGLYVHGMTMRTSKKSSDWWLQPPRHRISNGQYKADVEFDQRTELWKEVYAACLDAVNEHRRVNGPLL